MTTTDHEAVRWRKSTYSNGVGGECVEMAALHGRLSIRDSKDPGGPQLELTHEAARDLVRRLRGE
jgi:hypothetical protein